MSIPTHQKALFLEAKQGQWAVRTTETRKPGPGEIVVKLEAVALGGVEWKIQAWGVLIEKYPALLGLDGAGTVAELGEGVTSFAVGDRVYVSLFSLCASAADTSAYPFLRMVEGWFDYSDGSAYGTFQQYFTGPAQFVAKVENSLVLVHLVWNLIVCMSPRYPTASLSRLLPLFLLASPLPPSQSTIRLSPRPPLSISLLGCLGAAASTQGSPS